MPLSSALAGNKRDPPDLCSLDEHVVVPFEPGHVTGIAMAFELFELQLGRAHVR